MDSARRTEGQTDLANHLRLRLKSNRERVVPWIESFVSLRGKRILEIGCGTGSSTLALAERGAKITAIDILPGSIRVARDRCLAYGYNAEFVTTNAAKLRGCFGSRDFEAIIYYASLEHMTHEERRKSLRDAWGMLRPGAPLIVIETPNRLWYFDAHTSQLPFDHWLPDRLAFEYSCFSQRRFFREMYHKHCPEIELAFLRRGRGVSFHEFELFIAPRQNLEVVGCMHSFLRAKYPEEQRRWASSKAARHREILSEVCPNVHPAFPEPNLDLAIQRH